MLFEQGASDYAASSNLALLKATTKMINLLKEHGEKPEAYISKENMELIKDEELRAKMKGNLKAGGKI